MAATRSAEARSRQSSSNASVPTDGTLSRAPRAAALEQVLEAMSQGVAVFGPDLTLIYFNSHYEELLDFPYGAIRPGMPHAEILRLNRERGVRNLGDPDTEIEDRIARAAANDAPYRTELRLPDGRILSLRRTPLPDGGFVNTYTDITARKRAEAEVVEGREMLQAILDNMADGIRVFDGDLRLTAFNRQAMEFFRFPPELFRPGVSYEDFVRYSHARGDYGDDPTTIEERIARAREGHGRSSEQTLPDGRILQKRRKPMPGGGFVSTYSDITELKHAQEDLEEKARALESALDELRRSNTELEQFAYVASHDLQEPLRMVASYCQLLARRYGDALDEDGHEFIDYAVDGAERMQSLINDLLVYSRVGTRGKEHGPVALDAVLDAALANLRLAVEETGGEVSRDPLPTVHGDDVQLTQLFQNLIGNALKFRGEAAPRIHVGARREDDRWCISVADNGVGIESAYFDRIFLIFQRLHERGRYPGTGIGLAVCKKIVERHGGRIRVDSAPGEGSTFSFTLPTTGESP